MCSLVLDKNLEKVDLILKYLQRFVIFNFLPASNCYANLHIVICEQLTDDLLHPGNISGKEFTPYCMLIDVYGRFKSSTSLYNLFLVLKGLKYFKSSCRINVFTEYMVRVNTILLIIKFYLDI